MANSGTCESSAKMVQLSEIWPVSFGADHGTVESICFSIHLHYLTTLSPPLPETYMYRAL